MSLSYSYATIVRDDVALINYISKTLPTVTGVSDTATGVIVTFSAALTAPQQTTLSALISAYPDVITGPVDDVQLSTLNNSSLPLAASGVYTGVWEDVSRYSSIMLSILSDAASAASGVALQWGIASKQVDTSRSYTTVANVALTSTLLIPARYLRVVYTNGSTVQTSFKLSVRLSIPPLTAATDTPSPIDGNATVSDASLAQLTRSLALARTDVGTSVSVRADEEKRIRVRTQVASSVQIATGFSPVTQVLFTYSINPETTNTAVTTSGTVAQASGCAVLSTSAASGSSATVSTRRYVAGRVVRAVVSGAFAAGVAGCTQTLGIGTSENGLFVGYLGTAFGVLVRVAGVDTWTAATSFALDKLNGTGPSGVTVDPTKGNVYTVTYDSTGYGCASFALASCPAASVPEPVVFHRVSFGNAATALGLRNCAGPVQGSITNTTNTTAVSMRVASLAGSTDSASKASTGALRCVDVSKNVLTTSYIPLLSLGNMTSYQGVTNCQSVLLRHLSISSDGSRGSVVVALYDNAVQTDSVYADVSTATSTVRVDTASTSLSGGALLCSFSVNNSSDRQVDLTPLDINISPGSAITVACKDSIAGVSNNVSVSIGWSQDL